MRFFNDYMLQCILCVAQDNLFFFQCGTEMPKVWTALPERIGVREFLVDEHVEVMMGIWQGAWKHHALPTYLVLCMSSTWLFLSYLLQYTGNLVSKMFL